MDLSSMTAALMPACVCVCIGSGGGVELYVESL